MKVLYIDAPTGISGNMMLGALLELTGEEDYLRKELAKIPLDGYELRVERRMSEGLAGTYVEVLMKDGRAAEEQALDPGRYQQEAHHHHEHDEQEHHHDHDHDEHHDHHEHDHHHDHHHEHRSYRDICRMLEESSLTEGAKRLSLRIFRIIAEAEGAVHGVSSDKISFHEVGAVDSIVDIAGVAILLNKLAPEHIAAGVLTEGSGTIRAAHGILPVPVPAVTKILANGKIPFEVTDIQNELITPTGAAIASAVVREYGRMPALRLEKTGFGVGSRKIGRANLLRLFYGELLTDAGEKEQEALRRAEERAYKEGLIHRFKENTRRHGEHALERRRKGEVAVTTRDHLEPYHTELSKDLRSRLEAYGELRDLYVVEANIDDLPGEEIGFAMAHLLGEGALDVTISPLSMKKSRPAWKMEILTEEKNLEEMLCILFEETSTIGARFYEVTRLALPREFVSLTTDYGTIRGKEVVLPGGKVRIYPEYNDLCAASLEYDVPLPDVRTAFAAAARERIGNQAGE